MPTHTATARATARVTDTDTAARPTRAAAPVGDVPHAAMPQPAAPPDESVQERRYEGPERRRNVVDARAPGSCGLERRRGPGRRRSDFAKAAEEGEMTPEQFLFIKAVDAYKRANARPFPTWTEVLEVVRKLGYRKTAPMQMDLPEVQDWHEPGDAPAFPPPREDAVEA